LNTAGVSNSYDDEVAGLTKRYRYGNDDDADDDASSSRSPSPQRNTSSSRHWQRDNYYDQPPPRAPVLFFRTDKDGRYLSDDRMRCLTNTTIDDESSEEEVVAWGWMKKAQPGNDADVDAQTQAEAGWLFGDVS